MRGENYGRAVQSQGETSGLSARSRRSKSEVATGCSRYSIFAEPLGCNAGVHARSQVSSPKLKATAFQAAMHFNFNLQVESSCEQAPARYTSMGASASQSETIWAGCERDTGHTSGQGLQERQDHTWGPAALGRHQGPPEGGSHRWTATRRRQPGRYSLTEQWMRLLCTTVECAAPRACAGYSLLVLRGAQLPRKATAEVFQQEDWRPEPLVSRRLRAAASVPGRGAATRAWCRQI